MLALAGEKGIFGDSYNVLATWRENARDAAGGPLSCAHYLPEGAPEQLPAALAPFLSAADRAC